MITFSTKTANFRLLSVKFRFKLCVWMYQKVNQFKAKFWLHLKFNSKFWFKLVCRITWEFDPQLKSNLHEKANLNPEFTKFLIYFQSQPGQEGSQRFAEQVTILLKLLIGCSQCRCWMVQNECGHCNLHNNLTPDPRQNSGKINFEKWQSPDRRQNSEKISILEMDHLQIPSKTLWNFQSWTMAIARSETQFSENFNLQNWQFPESSENLGDSNLEK